MRWPDASAAVRHEGSGRAALRTIGVSTGGGRTTVVEDPGCRPAYPEPAADADELMLIMELSAQHIVGP